MANNTNTYTFVGISTLNGEVSVRYANSNSRTATLLRNGHTDVRFIALPVASREEDCIDALLNEDWVAEDFLYADAVAREALRLGFVL